MWQGKWVSNDATLKPGVIALRRLLHQKSTSTPTPGLIVSEYDPADFESGETLAGT
jgi:hypothetical protein